MGKKIGIACTTVFHYIHFKWIANELNSRGHEVEYVIYTPYHVNNRYERLQNFLEQQAVEFCSFEQLFIEKDRFDALLAPYFLPGFQLLDPNIKKVRGLYGYAKDRWNYAEWNEAFDLVLSYGPYAQKRLSQHTHVENIGHPRLRVEYQTMLEDIKGQTFPENGDKKPVLLYCPTWAELSSLTLFVENIQSFLADYTLLIKLHHGNVLADNPEVWSKLKGYENLYLFDEHTDLFDLLNQADAVLSDYSGAIFDAMLFQKPIILMDILQEEVSNTGMINLSKMGNIALYRSTKQDIEESSLDITVRQLLPHAKEIKEIKKLIDENIDRNNIPYQQLLSELYSYIDHHAPKRAAEAIGELLTHSIKREKRHQDFHIIDEQRIRSFLKKNENEPIAIWGAGEMGQILFFWLKEQGIEVASLYDMDIEKHGKKIQDITIEAPKLKGQILITVASHQDEISQFLTEHGFVENKDYISVFRSEHQHDIH